jgi:tetratricopeptide (TPR) repeat protein
MLAARSRFEMWAGNNDATVRVGRQALAAAEELGLDDVRSDVLNNIGTARVALGDVAGLENLEQSLAISLERNAPGEIHRGYHNLMESYRLLGRLAKSAEILAEERRSDERFGLGRQLRWVVAEEAVDGYLRGDWETALARAEELIAGAKAGVPHYMETPSRIVRASIGLARGDDGGADEDSARALELGRAQKDLQALTPALAARAFVLVAIGRPDEATLLVDEALGLPFHYSELIDLAWALTDLGRGEELLGRADEIARTPWRDAAFEIASRRPEQAVEICAEMENVAHEMYARLRSRSEAQVRRALDFYRSVAATRYVDQGEALLAKTA